MHTSAELNEVLAMDFDRLDPQDQILMKEKLRSIIEYATGHESLQDAIYELPWLQILLEGKGIEVHHKDEYHPETEYVLGVQEEFSIMALNDRRSSGIGTYQGSSPALGEEFWVDQLPSRQAWIEENTRWGLTFGHEFISPTDKFILYTKNDLGFHKTDYVYELSKDYSQESVYRRIQDALWNRDILGMLPTPAKKAVIILIPIDVLGEYGEEMVWMDDEAEGFGCTGTPVQVPSIQERHPDAVAIGVICYGKVVDHYYNSRTRFVPYKPSGNRVLYNPALDTSILKNPTLPLLKELAVEPWEF